MDFTGNMSDVINTDNGSSILRRNILEPESKNFDMISTIRGFEHKHSNIYHRDTLACHPDDTDTLSGVLDGGLQKHFSLDMKYESNQNNKPINMVSIVTGLEHKPSDPSLKDTPIYHDNTHMTSAECVYEHRAISSNPKEDPSRYHNYTPISTNITIDGTSSNNIMSAFVAEKSNTTTFQIHKGKMMSFDDFNIDLTNMDCDVTRPQTMTLQSSEVFDHLKLQTICVLGTGSTGNVYLVQTTSKNNSNNNGDRSTEISYFAAKTFTFDSKDEQRNQGIRANFQHEADILRQLKHENIIKMVYPVIGPSYGVLFLEFFPSGPLGRYLRQLTDQLVMRYFLHILSAVRYMHSLRFVHRDVKTDNVLVKGDKAVLTDFGLSEKLSKDTDLVFGCVGTPNYMAPEVKATILPFASFAGGYDGFKADSFSLGVLLWSMMRKTEPDRNTDYMACIDNDVNVFDVKYDSDLSESLCRMLNWNPNDRIGVTELYDCLEKRNQLQV